MSILDHGIAEARWPDGSDATPGVVKIVLQAAGAIRCPYALHHWAELQTGKSAPFCPDDAHLTRHCYHCGAIEWWMPAKDFR